MERELPSSARQLNRASPGMALLELAMNQAELLKRLQQIRWQQVVDHME